jgi:AhpD family alkylhydroperoxidase
MARIEEVPASKAGLTARLAYRFAPRAMRKLTGRAPEGGLEPLGLMAHLPGRLMMAIFRLEGATAKLKRIDQRLGDLAQLKAATLTHCEYCIDLGSQIARHRSGFTDEQLLALPSYRTSDLFSEVEKLVLDYAVAVSRTPVEVPDELFAQLREHLDDAQIVELTHLIALENYRGRFNLALGADAAGFSEGMVCALPAIAPAAGHGLQARPNAAVTGMAEPVS